MSDFPLSKAPQGLLGALDLKSLGRNPQDLNLVLQVGYEGTPHYLLPNRLCVAGSGPFPGVGVAIVLVGTGPNARYFSGGDFVCPQLETIRIKQLSVLLVRNAADAALTQSLSVFVKRVTGTQTVALGAATFRAGPATDLSFTQQVPLTEPLWLAPGDQLRLVPESNMTAAGASLGIQLDLDTMQSG